MSHLNKLIHSSKMNERFITSICHVNYGKNGATRIAVRDTTINEIVCSLILEPVNTDIPHDGIIGELTENGQKCMALWDLNTRRDYRRKGLAKMAVEYAVKLYSNVNIVLIAKPTIRYSDDIPLYCLVKFYESCGFEVGKKLSDRVIMKKLANNEF